MNPVPVDSFPPVGSCAVALSSRCMLQRIRYNTAIDPPTVSAAECFHLVISGLVIRGQTLGVALGGCSTNTSQLKGIFRRRKSTVRCVTCSNLFLSLASYKLLFEIFDPVLCFGHLLRLRWHALLYNELGTSPYERFSCSSLHNLFLTNAVTRALFQSWLHVFFQDVILSCLPAGDSELKDQVINANKL